MTSGNLLFHARSRFVGAGVLVLGLAMFGCSPAVAEVTVILTDYAFEPQQIAIQRAQKTILKLENKGTVEHNLAIPRQNLASQPIKPGGSATLEIALPQGDFPILCNIPGHEEQGMVGKLSASRPK